MLLYPRLPAPVEADLLEEQRTLSLEELSLASSLDHPRAEFPMVGGTRVDESQLRRLRELLRDAAREAGYPDASQAARRQFDRLALRILHVELGASAADASAPGVWSFLALVLVPELAPWRFPERHPERLRGTQRNALRRLWIRADALVDPTSGDPYHLADTLSEDAHSALLERSSLSNNRGLARSFASVYEKYVVPMPAGDQEKVVRDAAKRLIRLTPFLVIDALEHSGIEAIVQTTFAEATEALHCSVSIPRPESSGRLVAPYGSDRFHCGVVESPPERVAEIIAEARARVGVQQSMLADWIGTSQPNLSNIERGVARPTATLWQLLRVVLPI